MKFVAIDTSQEYLSVVAVNGEKKSILHSTDCAFQHSATLLDGIENCLEEVKMGVEEVELFGVTVGPGSFTGIRIGVATAKGFCAPSDIKVVAVTSFDTMAYAKDKGSFLTVIDAHHNNYYICGYTDRKITLEPKFVTLNELLAISGYSLISGKPIDSLKTEVVDTSKGLYNAIIANISSKKSADEIAPFYLRLSQAEEGRL